MQRIRLGKICLTHEGEWDENTHYAKLSYVTHAGDGWWNIVPSIGTEPTDLVPNIWRRATNIAQELAKAGLELHMAQQFIVQVQAEETVRAAAEAARNEAEQQREQVKDQMILLMESKTTPADVDSMIDGTYNSSTEYDDLYTDEENQEVQLD